MPTPAPVQPTAAQPALVAHQAAPTTTQSHQYELISLSSTSPPSSPPSPPCSPPSPPYASPATLPAASPDIPSTWQALLDRTSHLVVHVRDGVHD
eukprot:3132351-Pleurochrysis_carterae.AAC.1